MKQIKNIILVALSTLMVASLAHAKKTASELLDRQMLVLETTCDRVFSRDIFDADDCINEGLKVLLITEQRSRLGYNALKPLCKSSSNDPDGDGYGWENNETCIVKRGKADKGFKNIKRNNRILSNTITGPAIRFDANSSEQQLMDIQAKAIIRNCTQFSRNANIQNKCFQVMIEALVLSENRMFYSLNNGKTYCKKTDSDPDGDGYGWENEETCVVVDSSADKVENYDVLRELILINSRACNTVRNNRNRRNCYIQNLNSLTTAFKL